MSNREGDILREVMAAIGSRPDVRIFRNQVGQAVNRTTGQHVRFGLGTGSSDIVGILAPSGRWVAIEVKSEAGRVQPEQRVFLDTIRRMGGVAGVVRSAAEAVALIDGAGR